MDKLQLKSRFVEIFHTEPTLFKSPGRINLIGEHTDYNGGFVMPAAIDKAVYVAVSLRSDQEIHLYSESYQSKCISSLARVEKTSINWANYILGVVDQLLKSGYNISGFNLYIAGNVPLGAGLSSSAAVECATAFALSYMNGLSIPSMDLALISQQAEHHFAGVNCGIMDQFASVFGKKDRAIILDCKTMEYEYVQLNLKKHSLVLFNTNVKHALGDSPYNERRAQCEQGVAWVKEQHPEVAFLRDVNKEMLENFVKSRDATVYKRCLYVVEEIDRVRKVGAALKDNDLEELGRLMFETHKGLSEQYEVSCKEADFLVQQSQQSPAVLGARIMGGGFGGCTLNLIENEHIEEVIEQFSKSYFNKFSIEMNAYIVQTENGAMLIE